MKKPMNKNQSIDSIPDEDSFTIYSKNSSRKTLNLKNKNIKR